MTIEAVSASQYQGNKNKFSNFKNKMSLEKFYTSVKNSSDMTDTVVVPRTIFKGYLGFMAGTAMASIAALFAKSMPKTSKTLSFAGLITSLYGTFAFVRPYVIKDAPGIEKKK